MARHETPDIRTIAIAGHGSAGKTILTEALLLQGKAVKRLGSINDGSTVSDFDEQEKAAQHSIDSAMAFLTWKGKHVQIVDTPGYPDCIGEAISGMSAADAVIVAVDATAGVRVNTRNVWKVAREMGLPVAVVVTRADGEHARWDDLLPEIQANLSPNCLPIVVPAGGAIGTGLTGVEACYPSAGASDASKEAHGALLERAVEADEELMMRYLEGEALSEAEVSGAVSAAFRAGSLHPVFLTSAEKGIGVAELLDAVASFFPSPADRTFAATEEDGGADVEVSIDKPFTARVFKLTYDPFVGKVCYLRVVSGHLEPGSSVRTKDARSAIKVAHLYSVFGKETKDIEGAVAGDIIAVSKIEDLHEHETVTTGDYRVTFKAPAYPKPMVSVAVQPKSRGDESKINEALGKLVAADPTLELERSAQTAELVLSGMSNLHLDTVFSRLKSRYKIEAETHLPRIPYLETITGKAEADYRHKKQTGGAGQFAHVYLRIEPTERGTGFEFKSEVVGGAISQSFLPSIEKGIRSVMEKGIVAGYKFIDAKAVVYDGKEHPVDSKDIAFQIAGRNAFRLAVQKAKPVLLEPISNVHITVHADHMGAIMGDLNTRRGRIVNSANDGQYMTIEAQVPTAEMQTYSSELRGLTGGEGHYTMEESHYDVVPSHIAGTIIAQFKAEDED